MSNKPVYSGVKVFSEILSEKMTITGEYSLPIADGTFGQVIMTDGAGNATFQTITGFLTPSSIINGTGITWAQVGPTTVQGTVTLAPFSTTNLAEGVNLYYTNTRVNNQVASLLQPGLAGTGANSITWSYNPGLGTLTPTVSLAPFSTTNLVEGTRLYFTNERVDDRVAALLQNGTTGAGPASLTWSYNDPANTLTPIISLAPFTTDNLAEGSTNLYFTDERVDDRVSNLVQNSTTIGWTYNDLANTLCADIIGVSPVNVQRNGSLCGTQSTLNFKEGTGVTLSIIDDIGNNRVNIEVNASAGVSDAVIVVGTGPGTSVRKDACNTASGYYVTTSGGYCNTASNNYATIAGGKCNQVSASYSTISGGYINSILENVIGSIASYSYSGTATDGTYDLPQDTTTGSGTGAIFRITFVSNTVTSIIVLNPGSGYSVSDTITILGTSITGGTAGQNLSITVNVSNAQYSTIGGGAYNIAGSGCNGFSTISGGYCNVTGGDGSVVSGGSYNIASGCLSTISGGAGNYAQYSASIVGGLCNSATGAVSSIGGGGFNTASGYLSTLGGGCGNTASCDYSTIGGGRGNATACDYSTIGGGRGNCASGILSTISGGESNTASGAYSIVAGGCGNFASNCYSTISGGYGNTASGAYSVASGKQAVSSRYGEHSHSSGAFSVAGDAQRVQLLARTITVDDASQILRLDQILLLPTLTSGQVLSGTVNIVGIDSSGTIIARYLRQVTISNIGGTTSLTGSVVTLGTDEAAGTSVSITADDLNDALQIEVTGVNGLLFSPYVPIVINWIAHIDAVQITI